MHRPFHHKETPAPTLQARNKAGGEARRRGRPLMICFSHLRWDLVFQRPQHLMTRLAAEFTVLYWEEPVFDVAAFAPRLDIRPIDGSLCRVIPVLPEGYDAACIDATLRQLLAAQLADREGPVIFWYYTPMMLAFSEGLPCDVLVYDCMDELANFAFAPSDIAEREAQLMRRADLVFCGGRSLYEARRVRHPRIMCFPSGVDTDHFSGQGRAIADPADQAALPSPRLGFYGVIDERMDLALVAAMARMRPDWAFVMIGPVVKIAPEALPTAPNLHWLGGRDYADLPAYARHWDVALMPFACNASTRFISPTKTPEYMAAGLPVVSSPIKDVVDSYGGLGSVRIADSAAGFIAQCESLLQASHAERAAWRAEAEACLADKSWNAIAAQMAGHMREQLVARQIQTVTRIGKGTRRHYDVLVVGAGFAGAVMAERIATRSGKSVLLIDKRDHIGGNAYDHHNADGILVHRYGPHIFHTNSSDILDYLSNFTGWRPYEHRVLASVDGQLVPMPINRTTLNMLYGLDLKTDEDAAAYLRSVALDVGEVTNSRDTVVAQVGEDLYRKFFEGYTRKQWGVDPRRLDKSVAARVPARTNCDDRYFTDQFQCMPDRGYTAMFRNMLDHPAIDVLLGQDYASLPAELSWDHLIWTGPIDEYFHHRFGKLPYRSLRFEHETLDCEQAQPVGVVNYPDPAIAYTRITEYKHLTGQQAAKTSITREYPSDIGDPYYPVPNPEAQEVYRRYAALARQCEHVTFVGRLATYRYYNMDQIVGQALATWRRLDARWCQEALSGLGVVAAE